jgi:glycosyltransferase involved in cell wall biosynthesis
MVLPSSENGIRVLHIVPSLDLGQGGLPRAAYDLARHCNQLTDMQVNLVSRISNRRYVIDLHPDNLRPQILLTGPLDEILGWSFRKKVLFEFENATPDIVHIHGLWEATTFWGAKLALSHGVPLVIQPHGMLEPWALRQKLIKKRIGLLLYQRGILEGALLLIATSEGEFQSFRSLGLNQPIAVIRNGVKSFSDSFIRVERKISERRKILFLSRIHPKKGLLDLLEAWREISKEFLQWDIQIIGGADSKRHLRKVKKFVVENGLSNSVFFFGELSADQCYAAMLDSDLFVFPSYSENFGLVVAEAMSMGLPVIATNATPWIGLDEEQIGWTIKPGVEPLKNALRSALSLSSQHLHEMGQRATKYSERFRWDESAEQLAETYRWMSGSGACPEYVRLS